MTEKHIYTNNKADQLEELSESLNLLHSLQKNRSSAKSMVSFLQDDSRIRLDDLMKTSDNIIDICKVLITVLVPGFIATLAFPDLWTVKLAIFIVVLALVGIIRGQFKKREVFIKNNHEHRDLDVEFFTRELEFDREINSLYLRLNNLINKYKTK